MKEEKKKVKSSEAEEEYSKYIDEFAYAIIDALREQRTESLEPFEVYAERIKSKLYADPSQSCQRFIKGYRVLLEELGV